MHAKRASINAHFTSALRWLIVAESVTVMPIQLADCRLNRCLLPLLLLLLSSTLLG